MSTAPKNRKKLGLACAEKKRYNTYEAAIATAVNRTTSRHDRQEALRVYKCPHCNGFHLTSQVERRDGHWPVITA